MDPPLLERPLVDWWGVGVLLFALSASMILAVNCFDMSKRQIATLLILITLSAVAFIRRENSSGNPLFAGYLLRRPIILISAASAFLCGALLIGSTGFLPIWAESVAHSGPSSAGATVGILTFSWTIANICVGRVMINLGLRLVATASSCILVLGCVGLLVLNAHPSLILLEIQSSLIGIGLGVNTLLYTFIVQSAVGVDERTRSTALFFFFRMLGQTLGTALFGGVLNLGLGTEGVVGHIIRVPEIGYDPQILATGLQHVFLLFALLASAVLIASGFVTPSYRIPVDHSSKAID